MKTIGLALCWIFLALTARAQTSNPFPSPIPTGSVVADVADFALIPNSSGAKARVNQLDVTPAGRIFAIDQRGPIYAITADGGTVTPYLNLSAYSEFQLVSTAEAGFQSMAFHPDFNTVGRPGFGRFYTIFSSAANPRAPDFLPESGDAFDSVLLEWRCADPEAAPFVPAVAENPYREVLRIRQPFGNHNSGLLAFNPNAVIGDADFGKLYIGIGDGGSAGDPQNLAQSLTRIHGKILRIDPLGTNSGNGRYGIPTDNPFFGTSNLQEIWAYGLRNPQRFHWDRGGARRMFIADIGQNVVEEIDMGVPGGNYGWKSREGSYEYLDGQVSTASKRGDSGTTGYTYPIAEYDHSEGSAVTAGYVYRGMGIPGLNGKFLFGDLVRGRVLFINADTLPEGGQDPISELRLRYQGMEMSFLDIIRTVTPAASRADLRFGSDLSGSIYLLNKQDGVIRKLILPPIKVTSLLYEDSHFNIGFTTHPGLDDFEVTGSEDLNGFPDDLSGQTTISEPSTGVYQAQINLSGLPANRYFFQIIR